MPTVPEKSHKLTSHDEIRQHCSDVIHGFFDMINTRQYDTSHPFWTEHIDPNYTYSGLHGDFAGNDAVDLEGHLGDFRHFFKSYPEFRLEPVDDPRTEIHLDKKGDGVIRSVINYVQVHCPKGIVKSSVAEFKWLRSEEDARLMIWELRTVSGGAQFCPMGRCDEL